MVYGNILFLKKIFELAYKQAIKGKSKQYQVIEFNKNKEENLKNLRQLVIDGKFHTSEYKSETIYEPKERIIYKLPFNPDRIVQHAVMNVLTTILTPKFIQNSFACIPKRGQHKASIKCSEYVRKYKYCLKCDIHHFYPSIPHKELSDKFHKIIRDDKFLAIIDDIIYSFPGELNCPIGNYTSQWFGNFYLTDLDNYILHTLKPEGYERYCDDFLLFSNDKKKLNEDRKLIEEFIHTKLKLEFSKADLFDTKQGVDFCGYRHFDGYVLVRKSTAKKMKRRFDKIYNLLQSDEELSKDQLIKIRSQVASANGWLRWACSYRLKKRLKLDEIRSIVDSRLAEINS